MPSQTRPLILMTLQTRTHCIQRAIARATRENAAVRYSNGVWWTGQELLPPEMLPAGSSGLREDRDPQFDHVVPSVVLDEGAGGIGRSCQFFECLHGRADALIQPGRVSGDPSLQVPAAGQGRCAEPEAC